MDEDLDYRHKWEARAKEASSTLRAVLFGGAPDYVNRTLHDWHARVVTAGLLDSIPPGGTVLDVGAGFGRVSEVVARIRPDINLVGLDFSNAFCRSYGTHIGAAICCDVRRLPVRNKIADAVLLVTTLMYTTPREKAVLREVMSTLKPGGCLLLIEPGREAMELIRRLSPKTAKRTTGGQGFRRDEFDALFVGLPCELIRRGSNFFFTACLPLILTLKCLPRLGEWVAKGIVRLDMRFDMCRKLALHRWLLVRVKE